jgi:hypothetical protein
MPPRYGIVPTYENLSVWLGEMVCPSDVNCGIKGILLFIFINLQGFEVCELYIFWYTTPECRFPFIAGIILSTTWPHYRNLSVSY